MQNTKAEAPIFTDPFTPEERAMITHFEQECELGRLYRAFYATENTEDKCRIGREFVRLADYLKICNFVPENE